MALVVILNVILCAAVVLGIVGLLSGAIRVANKDEQRLVRRVRAQRESPSAARRSTARAAHHGGPARPYAS